MSLLTIALFAISASVVILLAQHKNPWPVIVLYWIVLTVKNLCDVLGG